MGLINNEPIKLAQVSKDVMIQLNAPKLRSNADLAYDSFYADFLDNIRCQRLCFATRAAQAIVLLQRLILD